MLIRHGRNLVVFFGSGKGYYTPTELPEFHVPLAIRRKAEDRKDSLIVERGYEEGKPDWSVVLDGQLPGVSLQAIKGG